MGYIIHVILIEPLSFIRSWLPLKVTTVFRFKNDTSRTSVAYAGFNKTTRKFIKWSQAGVLSYDDNRFHIIIANSGKQTVMKFRVRTIVSLVHEHRHATHRKFPLIQQKWANIWHAHLIYQINPLLCLYRYRAPQQKGDLAMNEDILSVYVCCRKFTIFFRA